MRKKTMEIYPGVFADVIVCTTCEDDFQVPVANGDAESLFLRKAFRAGGSLAVRLPKEIVDTLGIHEGSEINFKVHPQGVLIKVNGIHKRM